jgi:hypothetical protein
MTIVEGMLRFGGLCASRCFPLGGSSVNGLGSGEQNRRLPCPALRNVLVANVSCIRHFASTSRKQTHTLSLAARFGKLYTSKSLNVAQVEPFERRSGCMEQKQSSRGRHLTPAQAREGHRWIRLTVLAAVLQAWMILGVITLADPRQLTLFLAFGVAYSLAAPLLLRYLSRDVDRRVTTSAQDSFARLVHAGGLPSSSSLGTPPR